MKQRISQSTALDSDAYGFSFCGTEYTLAQCSPEIRECVEDEIASHPKQNWLISAAEAISRRPDREKAVTFKDSALYVVAGRARQTDIER